MTNSASKSQKFSESSRSYKKALKPSKTTRKCWRTQSIWISSNVWRPYVYRMDTPVHWQRLSFFLFRWEGAQFAAFVGVGIGMEARLSSAGKSPSKLPTMSKYTSTVQSYSKYSPFGISLVIMHEIYAVGIAYEDLRGLSATNASEFFQPREAGCFYMSVSAITVSVYYDICKLSSLGPSNCVTWFLCAGSLENWKKKNVS